MTEAQDWILAGALQTPGRIVEIVELDEEVFTGDQRKLFVFMIRYFKKRDRKNSLDLALARSRLERLEKAPPKLVAALFALIDEYDYYDPISDSEFRDALAEVVEEHRQRLLKDHAGAAVDALRDEDYAAAEDAMRGSLIALEDAAIDAEPPVDIRSETAVDQARVETQEDHENEEGEVQSFDLGMRFISDRVSFRRRELTIFGGYSADGKTQVSKSLILNANQVDGANVLWCALEMTRKEMQTLFVAQHAANLDPKGVRYRQILEGEATERERKLYDEALVDFKSNPDAGRLEIWSPNEEITFARYRDRARAVKRKRGLDILVLDYLGLLDDSDMKGDHRHIVSRWLKWSKALARELNVWHLVLHQISRKGRDEAEKRTPNHYIQRDLGDSAGVERAADSIMWSFTNEELKDDKHCKVGIAKARKGDTYVHGRYCYADFAKGIVGEIDDEDLGDA